MTKVLSDMYAYTIDATGSIYDSSFFGFDSSFFDSSFGLNLASVSEMAKQIRSR
jgi:hypothetical protein